jgi:hypothetical protein
VLDDCLQHVCLGCFCLKKLWMVCLGVFLMCWLISRHEKYFGDVVMGDCFACAFFVSSKQEMISNKAASGRHGAFSMLHNKGVFGVLVQNQFCWFSFVT